MRKIRGAVGSTLSVLALTAGALVGSAVAPAKAAPYCERGVEVVGDIENRYTAMGGPTGPLGCPLTEELVNPDGVGRRTQFQNGTIYWSRALTPDVGQGVMRLVPA
ncbi:LGFP repeat-containing protein [Kitasatospora sp. NPDC001574]